MSAGLPRASLGENVRFMLTYLLPSFLRGYSYAFRPVIDR